MRVINVRVRWLLLAMLAGCECTPFGIGGTRFVCATQADCADGFECRDRGAGLECVVAQQGDDAGSVDSGIDAGLDAGEQDAGEVDAGEVDAGEFDSGVDAGDDDAGVDAGLDAGIDAGFDAGIDAGFDAGVDAGPTQLRFATAPQSIPSNACSQVINLETIGQDGGARPVGANTTVMLQAATAVSFFTASNCSGSPASSVVISALQSSTSFYARSVDAGTYLMTASSSPLLPASQTLTVLPPPSSLVFTSTAPNPVRGGTCLMATVEARRGTVATPVGTATSIGLSATPSSGTIFYSDAACTTTTTSATMAANASTATFFVKPLTTGTNAMAAAAPFGTATQNFVTTRIVRRGQCNFVARVTLSDGGVVGDTSNTCTFSPAVTDVNAALLIIQTTAQVTGPELGVAEARCRIASNATIFCARRQDFDPASLHYQIAEVPQGMLVQRSSSFSCTTPITLATPVNPARSFVLKATVSSSGAFDDDDAAIAALTSPTTFTLTPTECDGHDVQVVDWAGITVTRGAVDGGFPTDAGTLTITGLPAASANRALLIQPGILSMSSPPVCSSMVRAATPSPSSIVFTRAAGDATCLTQPPELLAWERIDFGNKATVREHTATFAVGDTSRPVTIAPVDTSRTLVFSGSQMAGGQGAGETDHDGGARFTQAAFELVLTDATTVTVSRAESTAAAIITFYVAELLP